MEGQFLVRQIYEDEITYNLIGAAVEILSTYLELPLRKFSNWKVPPGDNQERIRWWRKLVVVGGWSDNDICASASYVTEYLINFLAWASRNFFFIVLFVKWWLRNSLINK